MKARIRFSWTPCRANSRSHERELEPIADAVAFLIRQRSVPRLADYCAGRLNACLGADGSACAADAEVVTDADLNEDAAQLMAMNTCRGGFLLTATPSGVEWLRKILVLGAFMFASVSRLL